MDTLKQGDCCPDCDYEGMLIWEEDEDYAENNLICDCCGKVWKGPRMGLRKTTFTD